MPFGNPANVDVYTGRGDENQGDGVSILAPQRYWEDVNEGDTIPGFSSDQQYIPIVSESEPQWTGATGMVHEYLQQNLDDNCKDHEYYIAGPPPMVDAVRRHLILDRGIPVEQLHYDRFY